MKRLIFDTSNILFRVVFATLSGIKTEEDKKYVDQITLQGVLRYLLKFYNDVKPDVVAFAFEGSDNWRVAYTKDSDLWSSGVVYKANRAKVDPEVRALHKKVSGMLLEIVRDYSSCEIIQSDILEGDDCIAAYVQEYAPNGDTVVCISGDRDFLQLDRYGDNFQLIDPETRTKRSLKDECGVDDWEFFLFHKCIRGDKGDNVPSAYPRVRHTKIVEAYEDEQAKSVLMESYFTTSDGESVQVSKRFNENKVMMGLDNQPVHVRQAMRSAVQTSKVNRGAFSIVRFLSLCHKQTLPVVKSNIHAYARMFG